MIHELTTAHPYTGKLIYSADSKKYTHKPATEKEKSDAKTGTMSTKAHTSSTIFELAQAISQGRTISGAQLRPKQGNERTDERIINQQLVIADIDNVEKQKDSQGNTLEYRSANYIKDLQEILSICHGAGIEPCIIYESFSHGKPDPNGDPIPKYRAVFALSEPISEPATLRKMLANLIGLFKGNADNACKDPARMFYGTGADKEVYYCNVVNSSESLLNCYHEPEPARPTQKQEASRPAPARTTSKGRAPEADPDVLLCMIDPNAPNYGGEESAFIQISSAYKAAGGSLDVWLQWCRGYTLGKKSAQEQEKENRTTWRGLHCTGAHGAVTIASLKKAAKKYAPDEYESYMQALNEKPARTRKKKNSAPAVSSEADSEDLFREEPVKEWNPIPYPEDKQKPQNYIDFAFENITNNKRTVDPYLLASNVRKTSRYIFVKGDDPAESARRYWYRNGVYNPVNDEFIKSRIRKRLEVFGSDLCKKRYIEEAFYHLTIDPVFHYDSELNADENIINFQNGLLHLDTGKLTEHTPDYLSTIQIPCNYTPGLDFKDCPTFTQFISRLGNYDNDSIQTLIEFIGVAISNVFGPIYKKALFLKGAGNCGKSQYFSLLGKLLGEKYFASTSLENLESRFGAYSLYNKRLAGDPDCKFFKIGDLNRFKVTTGGDPQKLEAKGKNEFTYKYRGLLLFGCNDLPFFGGDNGKWVYDRMLIIRCGPPVTDQERDPKIIDKLKAELEAIVSISVRALKNTMKAYKFTESQASRQELSEYRDENDPVKRFLNECCILREENTVLRDGITQQRFYEIYLEWYRKNGNRSAPTVQQFRRSLTQATDVYNIKDLEKKSGNNRYYIYTVTEEARKQYGAFDTLPQYGTL